MTVNLEQLNDLTDGKVLAPDGSKIGGVGQFYLDNDSGAPEWVTVTTGLFGTSESFVPLTGATASDGDVVVQYDKQTILDAPRVDADGSLSEAEEEQLYAYYGRGDDYAAGYATTGTGTDTTGTLTTGTTGTVTDTTDTVAPTTDNAMTRSEEQLHVGVERREAGRARLRKYVVSENVTETVPLRHEEVRVSREPITDANRADALDGPEITEAVHEVTLHEERPVVQKETVPVERISLDTEQVVEQATVNETVRKEEIEVEGVEGTTGVDSEYRR